MDLDKNWWLTISSLKINEQQGYSRLSIRSDSPNSDSILVRKFESEREIEKDEDLWKVHWTKEEDIDR